MPDFLPDSEPSTSFSGPVVERIRTLLPGERADGGTPGHGPHQPGPNQSGPNQPGPNQPGPNQPGPNQIAKPAWASLLEPRGAAAVASPLPASGPPMSTKASPGPSPTGRPAMKNLPGQAPTGATAGPVAAASSATSPTVPPLARRASPPAPVERLGLPTPPSGNGRPSPTPAQPAPSGAGASGGPALTGTAASAARALSGLAGAVLAAKPNEDKPAVPVVAGPGSPGPVARALPEDQMKTGQPAVAAPNDDILPAGGKRKSFRFSLRFR
jgi:hypothetical protein